MTTISALEAKSEFDTFLDRVAKGEQFIITRNDKRVARVLPEADISLAEVQKAVDGLRQLRREIDERTNGKQTLTDEEVREAIDEGRM